MHGDDWVIVYRGFSVPALDLAETMLRAEGLEPRRLGQARPSLLGVGDSAIEQLIEVPREHEQAARDLIAASLQTSGDAKQADELEAQALNAAPEPPGDAADAKGGGFDAKTLALFIGLGLLLYFWLR